MHSSKTVLAYMTQHALVLTTAESCTSGLIAAQLADIPGAGKCLDRAYVTYTPEAKMDVLGVHQETIDQYNLTSEAVAREMALGALRASDANVAISNTGVVDDSDPDIPAGTQCYGWALRDASGTAHCFTEEKLFSGGRREIREASAAYALSRLPIYHERMTAASGK